MIYYIQIRFKQLDVMKDCTLITSVSRICHSTKSNHIKSQIYALLRSVSRTARTTVMTVEYKFQALSELIRKMIYTFFLHDIILSTYHIKYIKFKYMQVDVSILLDRAQQHEIELILSQWHRLQSLLGDANTFALLSNMLQEQSLFVLVEMSEEDILMNYAELQTEQKMAPQMIKPQVTTNKEKKTQQKKKLDNVIIRDVQKLPKGSKDQQKPQKMGSKAIKFDNSGKKEPNPEKKEETDFERIKRCLKEGLQQYSLLSMLKYSEVNELIQFVQTYEKSSKVLKCHEINKQVSRLNGQKPKKSNIFDYIQVVDSALYHTTDKHRLRSTQIIALLLFLNSSKKKVLLQILTGEGKSTTISSLAAIMAISGRSVDIVTTSTLLASRDVQEKKSFYKILGLDAEDNLEDKQFGEKQCYRSHKIVNGTPHKFQVDILMNDYKKRGTRCGRPYDVLIVDEVDSMFIDQKGHQTLIATTYPGFAELSYPMKIIWNKITSNPVFKQGKTTKIALATGQNEVVTAEAKVVLEEVVKDIRKSFKNEIIPEWRMNFIEESLDHWVNSAIEAAFYFKENVHYVIQGDKIVPIDARNTGELQHNVHWSNGLHQFLEIKHGLPFTTESMTSNFISNIGNFDKYPELYGLTGTLGSDKAKQFLKTTYKAELFKVPPFKERKLKCEPGQTLYDEATWARAISRKIKQMVDQKRSVLVLCQSIQEVNRIQFTLQTDGVDTRRTQLLTHGTEKIDDRIDCGELLLATNLAGRGADIKITQALSKNGGLHVIIGFMPANSRVQMQGRGRAGRNGHHGSSQLAVNLKKYCNRYGMQYPAKWIFENTFDYNVQRLCNIRDLIEAQQMEKDENQVEELRSKDHVFGIYCKAMNEIPDFLENQAKQLALEEQWAMFLKRADNLKLPYKELQAEAKNLCQQLKYNSDGYYNPNYTVQRGLNSFKNDKNVEAIEFFKRAQQDTGTLPQIIGGLYQNALQINLDKENIENIQSSIKGLKLVQSKIQHRQEMRQGLNIYDAQNQKITNALNQGVQEENNLFNTQIKSSASHSVGGSNMDPNISIKVGEARTNVNIKQFAAPTAEDRILAGFSRQIDDLVAKYSNLGKGEYVQVQWEPSRNILPTIDGDPQENEKALDKLYPEGLKYLPRGIIKKKKVSSWKRIGVFLLGVVQIVVGSIIVACTSGVLIGFGVTMMMQGARWCFDSIFRPEELEDLGKYLSQTAIRYAFAFASAGLQGIRELGVLCQRGASLLTTSMKGFLESLVTNTGLGLKKAFETNSIELISSGLTHLVANKKNNRSQSLANPVKIITQNAESIRSEVNKGVDDEKKLDFPVEKTIQKFTSNFQKALKKSIACLDKNLLAEVKNLPMQVQHISILIKDALNNDQSFKSGSNEGAKLMKLFCKELQSANLATKYAEMIQLDKKIEGCLKHIKGQQNFNTVIDSSLKKLILESLMQMKQTKVNELTSLKASIQSRVSALNNNTQITVAAHNQQAQAIKKQITRLQDLVAQLNEKCFKVALQPTQILEQLKNNKAIENGRLNPTVIDSMQFHPYVKTALKSLAYSDSSKQFEQILEAAIFNTVGNYAIKLIDNCYESSKGSATRLSKIASMIKGDA